MLLVSSGAVSAMSAMAPRTAEELKSAELPAEARSDNSGEESIRNTGYDSDFPPLANYYAAAYKHLPRDQRAPSEESSDGQSYFDYDYPALFSNYYSNVYDYFPQVYGPLGYYYPGYSGIFGPIPYQYVYRTSYDTPLTAIDSLELFRSGANGRPDPVVVPPADTFKLPKMKKDRS